MKELSENEKRALFDFDNAFVLLSALRKFYHFHLETGLAELKNRAAVKSVKPWNIVSFGDNPVEDDHLRWGQFWETNNTYSIFVGFDYSLADYRAYPAQYRKYSEYVFGVSFKKNAFPRITDSDFEDAIEVDNGWVYVRMGNASFLEKQKFVDKFMEVINKLIP